MRAVLGCATVFVAALSLAGLTGGVTQARVGCITGYNPTAVTVPASGAAYPSPATFSVLTATPTCRWDFDNTSLIPAWMTLPSSFGGNGPGSVSFSAVPNLSLTPRTATLSYDGMPIVITQAGAGCLVTMLSPSPVLMPANGGTGSFTVNATGTSCSYSVQFPNDSFTLVSGGSGNTFPATVTFTLGPNTTADVRHHDVLVSTTGTFGPGTAGVRVTQSGPPVTTDATRGIGFAVHRSASAPAHVTGSEPVRITNALDPTATWTATTTTPWLVVTPSTGVSPGVTEVSIDPVAVGVFAIGNYEGRVRITSSVAPQTPREVYVFLRITDATSETSAPHGALDVPVHGASGLSGAVPVGGWAVDDVGIRRVRIYRSPVAGEPWGPVYLGDATRVRGARPDIPVYSTSPEVTRAGWGLMVLSNVLPNNGNGTFVLSAIAEDIEGRGGFLGQTTVTFDNTNSVFPFGTIDVPSQGGAVSGTAAAIHGWVLAQPGKAIPFDGSTIRLLIDGAVQPQVASYGHPRPDVASFFPFPTYANGNGPAAQFLMDTTAFANGLHTMAWLAVDDQGVTQGIGSRYFTIDNGAASQFTAPESAEARSAAAVQALPQATALVWSRQGFDEGTWSLQLAGGRTNAIRQAPGARLEVALDSWWWPAGCGPYAGYLMTGDVAGPLPPGASIDGEKGVFSWLPPAEFGGTFEFVFVQRACNGPEQKIPLRVTIAPR